MATPDSTLLLPRGKGTLVASSEHDSVTDSVTYTASIALRG
jgi:hypothetical protein